MPRILTAKDEARQEMLEKVNMIWAIRLEENLFPCLGMHRPGGKL